MSIALTGIGWILVPITVLIALCARDWLLGWTTFSSVFQASAAVVITIGNRYPIGIQPGYFAAAVTGVALLLLRPQRVRPWPGNRALHQLYALFLAFGAYAVATSFLIPHYLAGQLLVYPPREGLNISNAVPLKFSNTNVTQDLYVILIGGLFLLTCNAVYTARDAATWRNTVRGWLWGGVFAGAIGIYQVAGERFRLPFPFQFFNSNPGYAEGAQSVNGFTRLSGTFSEPSEAAYFLSAICALALWRVLFGRGSKLDWAALGVSVIALALATSSIGYLTTAVIIVVAIGSLGLRARFSPRVVVRTMLLALLAAGAAALVLTQRATAGMILQAEIFEKMQSTSYVGRAASNVSAWTTVLHTYGAGAGWGSTRASSLVLNILGNVGFAGLALVLACLIVTFRMVSRARQRVQGEIRVDLDAVSVAVLALLCAGAIAQPDLMQIPLWMGIALLAGAGARVQALCRVRAIVVRVNARILSNPLTGVQRYLSELLARLPISCEPVAPRRPLGGAAGHLWEQLRLPARAAGHLLWSPSNTGPLWVERQVVTMHDTAWFDYPESLHPAFVRWYGWLLPRLGRRVRKVITGSEFSRGRLEHIGVPADKIVVIPDGVDARFSMAATGEFTLAPLHLPARRYLLSLGSLQPYKNLAGLIAAWRAALPRLPPNLWLVIAGGAGKTSVFRPASLADLPARVHLAGHVADELLPALYARARGFVLVTFYEGFGLPALEAMAAGTPLISSRSGSLAELVEGVSLEVDPHDTTSIAQGIERVAWDDDLCARLTAAGRQRAACYSWDRTAAATARVLLEAGG